MDLGHSRLVYRVDITNRIMCFDRFKMVRIGTTNQSPETVAPGLTNFEICHSYNPAVGPGITQGFYCGSTGRYLVIQLQQPDQILSICEVQVIEERSLQYMVSHAAKESLVIHFHSCSMCVPLCALAMHCPFTLLLVQLPAHSESLRTCIIHIR